MMKRLIPLLLLALMVCQYIKWDGWTIDRLIAGNMMRYNVKHSEYLQAVTQKYPIARPFLRDCRWGIYFKLDDKHGLSTNGGFVIRF